MYACVYVFLYGYMNGECRCLQRSEAIAESYELPDVGTGAAGGAAHVPNH